MKLLLLYVFVMNLSGFFLMWTDKRRAIQKKYRVPEKVLFGISLLGGSVGTWAGMYAFRHKTRHWYFVIGMPLILLIQLGIAGLLYAKGIWAPPFY